MRPFGDDSFDLLVHDKLLKAFNASRQQSPLDACFDYIFKLHRDIVLNDEYSDVVPGFALPPSRYEQLEAQLDGAMRQIEIYKMAQEAWTDTERELRERMARLEAEVTEAKERNARDVGSKSGLRRDVAALLCLATAATEDGQLTSDGLTAGGSTARHAEDHDMSVGSATDPADPSSSFKPLVESWQCLQPLLRRIALCHPVPASLDASDALDDGIDDGVREAGRPIGAPLLAPLSRPITPFVPWDATWMQGHHEPGRLPLSAQHDERRDRLRLRAANLADLCIRLPHTRAAYREDADPSERDIDHTSSTPLNPLILGLDHPYLWEVDLSRDADTWQTELELFADDHLGPRSQAILAILAQRSRDRCEQGPGRASSVKHCRYPHRTIVGRIYRENPDEADGDCSVSSIHEAWADAIRLSYAQHRHGIQKTMDPRKTDMNRFESFRGQELWGLIAPTALTSQLREEMKGKADRIVICISWQIDRLVVHFESDALDGQSFLSSAVQSLLSLVHQTTGRQLALLAQPLRSDFYPSIESPVSAPLFVLHHVLCEPDALPYGIGLQHLCTRYPYLMQYDLDLIAARLGLMEVCLDELEATQRIWRIIRQGGISPLADIS